jgi:hypothetical protein
VQRTRRAASDDIGMMMVWNPFDALARRGRLRRFSG